MVKDFKAKWNSRMKLPRMNDFDMRRYCNEDIIADQERLKAIVPPSFEWQIVLEYDPERLRTRLNWFAVTVANDKFSR